jgi:putative ABC transport system permease protein
LSHLLADIRYAFRSLRRSPLVTALGIAILALGIGATTALFSLVDAVLLRALPYAEAERLVEIFGQDSARGGMRVPGPIVEALRERSTTLAAIGIHGPTRAVLRAPEGAVELRGDRVSANYLDVMGVSPLIGRGFHPGDDLPGAPPVMLVSHAFWQRRLQGDPHAVGRTIVLDNMPYRIAGVMAPEFRTQFRGPARDYWTTYIHERGRLFERTSGYELVARLAPHVTMETARREARAIAAGVTHEGWGEGRRVLGLHTLRDEIVGTSAYALQLLLAAVAVVLAMVCANLAQLLLARSDRRVREFAVRKAIGASQLQLFRLALIESLMLSGAGGLAGIVLAYWLLPVAMALAPEEIPRLAESAIDGRVLAVALGLTLLTGCVFGLAPALRLSRWPALEALTTGRGSAGPRGAHFRSSLVIVQVTVSVALFALAGLAARTFLTLLPSDLGFEAKSRTVFVVGLRPDLFPSAAARLGQLDELTRRLRALPGISDVALATNVPFSGDDHFDREIRAAAETANERSEPIARADVRGISENLFPLLKQPILRGRNFGAADGRTSPKVAIVNQQLAGRLASGGDVLGKRIRVGPSTAAPALEIVGVVADARAMGESVSMLNEVYIPYAQSSVSLAYLVVASPLDSGGLTPAIRREIHAAAPDLPLHADQAGIAMEGLIHRSLAGPRFSAALMSAFSAISLGLAAIGLFGLVAHSVSQRYHELGIRAALGAGPNALLIATMKPALVLTALGTLAGLATGAYLTRFVESQLYAIEPLDTPTFAGAALVMLVTGALAAYLPARRAVSSDPLTALRQQ